MLLGDLFDVEYGHSLALNHLELSTDTANRTAFVSRTARNNGVSAWVRPIADLQPLPAGKLTVCLRSRNHALATFVQPHDFYTGYHVYVLEPKTSMTIAEKLWWSTCIEANRFRYNFGRQANRSLRNLEIPDSAPRWVDDYPIPEFRTESPALQRTLSKRDSVWSPYRLDALFEIKRGRNILRRDMRPGPTGFVGASAIDNGVTSWIDVEPDYPGGQITVSTNGSIGEAFYQDRPFVASGDVAILVPHRQLSVETAIFLCAVIRKEKYRWNYGRKWGISRMKETIIKLPSDENGQVDWAGIERTVKDLPSYTVLNTPLNFNKN